MKWIDIIKSIAPLILATVHNGVLSAIAPMVAYSITEAESLVGASGPEKLAHALNIVNAAITGTNSAAGKVIIDPVAANSALTSGIATVISVANLLHKSL